MRWQQFDALISGKARMDEPGFAYALYGAVSGEPGACRTAADWVIGSANPNDPDQLRQSALVYDWCQPTLGEARSNQIARKLTPALSSRPTSPQAVRSAVFAALAAADLEPRASAALLQYSVEGWWRKQVQPQLSAGRNPFERKADLMAAVEFLHTIRDNLRADLRDGSMKWFEQLPPMLVLSYYPAPWPAAENEYRIPMYDGAGEPDLRQSALGRAAELALVAYDTNAQPNQFLQGWLIQDRFLMRGAFGITHEFLWANPYLPGLSYTYMPDQAHTGGVLLARSDWDEDATWFGYRDGKAQVFRNGTRMQMRLDGEVAPLTLGATRVFFGQSGLAFTTGWLETGADAERPLKEEFAFVVGLEPDTLYDIEVDDEELAEARTDSGGILALAFPVGRKAGVRIRKAAPLGS
ncbi:MAG: hypothetical protein C0504_12865 [Candidatus Solibacter sp.]|nr:hypothetical protein [Candidatus Solibacter sp.]